MASREVEPVSPMWLAHHYSDDYERCETVGGRHVCRRCLALYPLAMVVMVAAAAGLRWPEAWDPALLVLLPLPSLTEFVGEHLGLLSYRPGRQVALTLPMAVAAGVGFGRYLENQADALFWAVASGYGAVAVVSAFAGPRFAARRHDR